MDGASVLVLASGLLTAPVLRRIGLEHLTSAEERPLDADVLETIEIAGQRVFRQHGHIRDLADLELIQKRSSFQVS